MKRWVGLGVIADNLINIGRAISKREPPKSPPHRRHREPAGLFPADLSCRRRCGIVAKIRKFCAGK
jgi:hypothetical protein